MDLRDSPEEAAFRERVRSWLADNVPRDAQRRSRGLADGDAAPGEEGAAFSRAWQHALYDAGFLGLSWPKEYGGQGMSALFQFIWQEELARAAAPPIGNTIGLGWAGPAIIGHGSDDQKRRYLEPILRGDEIWCQLFSEPGAGSDLAAVSTKAIASNGDFVVNGQKVWTSGAREADLGILVARTDLDAPKHRGVSFFALDMRSPGIEIRPIRQMNDADTFNEVFLTDVRLPAQNLIGALNDGWRVALTTLQHERIGLSLGRGSLWGTGPTVDDLASAVQDRLGNPAIRDRFARVYVDAVAHRMLKLRLVTKAERGEVGAEASIQKLFGDAWGQRLNELAVDAAGLRGQVWHGDWAVDDGTWQSSMLYSRALTIGGGTTEVQKNIIGERILGLPKEPGLR